MGFFCRSTVNIFVFVFLGGNDFEMRNSVFYFIDKQRNRKGRSAPLKTHFHQVRSHACLSSWTRYDIYTSPEEHHSCTHVQYGSWAGQRSKALEALANIARQANRMSNQCNSSTSTANQLPTPPSTIQMVLRSVNTNSSTTLR